MIWKPPGVNTERKKNNDCEKVPKLAFQPTRLQHNDDPILSLRSSNKLYTKFIFYFL